MRRIETAPPSTPGRYNLHVIVAESFANRLLSRQQIQEGVVRDFILGADVHGHQMTVSRLAVRFRPNRDRAQLDLVLSGMTRSDTVGLTNRAAVNTRGRHEFQALKDVVFDGAKFQTRSAVVFVDPQTQITGTSTPLDQVPVLGNIAGRIAYRAAEKRKPEADAIARQRVTQRVQPEFNRQIDEQLGKVNTALDRSVRTPLRELELLPSAERVCTNRTHLFYSAFLEGENAGREPRLVEDGRYLESGLTLYVHESLLNNLIDRFRPENRLLSAHETWEVGRRIAAMLRAEDLAAEPSTQADPGFGGPPPAMRLAERDPVRFRVEEDRLIVTLRASFEAGGQTVVPVHEITIPFTAEVEEDRIVLSPGEVDAEGPDDLPLPQAVELRETLISSRIQSALPRLAFPRQFPLPIPEAEKDTLRIRGFEAVDGWLIVTVE